nr:hypothetical protein CFP56_04040 [Quercus suber]
MHERQLTHDGARDMAISTWLICSRGLVSDRRKRMRQSAGYTALARATYLSCNVRRSHSSFGEFSAAELMNPTVED